MALGFDSGVVRFKPASTSRRRGIVLACAAAVVVAVVVLVVASPSKSAALASAASSDYSTWLRSIGAGEFAPSDSVQIALPKNDPGPYMLITEKNNRFYQPSDYIRALERNEKKEEKKLRAIQNLLNKHNSYPTSIEVNLNRRAQPGPIGPMGDTGREGPQGPQGWPGPHGHRGKEGSVGPQGSEGFGGPQGPMGPPGEIGLPGPVGPTGPAGPQGDVGAVGRPGVQGNPGPAGTNGAMGAAGGQGPPGPPGAVGPEGPAGANGVNGHPLRPEFNGKGAVLYEPLWADSLSESNLRAAISHVPGMTQVDTVTNSNPTTIAALPSEYQVIVIPQFKWNTPSLSAGYGPALARVVNDGMTMVVIGSQYAPAFINAVFNTSYAYSWATCTAEKQPATAATRFDSDPAPATLPYEATVYGISTASIGPSARTDSMYACDSTSTVVRLKYGSGYVIYLGLDWEGTVGADWTNVLNAALKFGAQAS